MNEFKEIFASALDNYPIQTGLILIALSIIFFLFTLNNAKKRSFWDRTPSGKKAHISAWTLIISLFVVGLIYIVKNI